LSYVPSVAAMLTCTRLDLTRWDSPTRGATPIRKVTDVKFTLTIEMGNGAMNTPSDVMNALRKLADHVDPEGYPDKWASPAEEGGKIRDVNGNTVGKWEVVA